MRLTVWIDDWQHECCGQPFSIGSTLHWTLGEPDESVGLLFGPDLSVHVDREEDRHYVLTEIDAPETVGTVTAIRSVHVRAMHRIRMTSELGTGCPALLS